MSQIIVEVFLSLVLGIVGANIGKDSELKDISWRTEMRKRYSPYDISTPDVLMCALQAHRTNDEPVFDVPGI
jgi:hypothetical protein